MRDRKGQHGRWAWCAALALGWVCAASAADKSVGAFEDLLPANTLLSITIRNPSALPAYKESGLYKVLNHAEMLAFRGNVREEFERLCEAYKTQMPVDPRLVEELIQGEVSVAFTGLGFSQKGPEPGVVLSVTTAGDAGEIEDSLLALLAPVTGGAAAPKLAFEQAGITVKSVALPMGEICYAWLGKRLVATYGQTAMRSALAQIGARQTSLAANAAFVKVAAETKWAESTCKLYANAQLLLAQFGPMLPPEVGVQLQTAGLGSIQAVGGTSRFADGGIRDTFYVYAPGPRTGVVPPAGKPVDLDLLRLVPKHASMMSLSQVDWKSTYAFTMQLLAALEPGNDEKIQAVIAQTEQRLGFSIKRDLLGSLGKQTLIYRGPQETVLMIQVRNKDKLEQCLTKLATLAPNKIEWDETVYKGSPIRHLDITGAPVPFTPSYVMYKGYVVVGLFPQTIKSFLARAADGGPSIMDNADFKRVAGEWLKGCDGISYSDIGRRLVSFYDLLVFAAQSLHGVPQVWLQPELMPSAHIVTPYVFGMGGGVRNDKDGILSEVFSPLGASGALVAALGMYADITGSGNIVTVGVAAAMVLPALTRARGQARSAVCRSNLKQIGLGIAMYMNDHDEQIPKTLDELFPEYISSKNIFKCPSDNAPVTIGKGIKCSYRYVGRLPKQAGAGPIVAYDKHGNHRRGRNALYYDGHVDFVPERGSPYVLQISLELVKKAGWDKLPPERRKQIEAFYADAK